MACYVHMCLRGPSVAHLRQKIIIKILGPASRFTTHQGVKFQYKEFSKSNRETSKGDKMSNETQLLARCKFKNYSASSPENRNVYRFDDLKANTFRPFPLVMVFLMNLQAVSHFLKHATTNIFSFISNWAEIGTNEIYITSK